MIAKCIVGCLIIITIAHLQGLDIEVVTEQYPPFNYEQDGQVQGIATEIVQSVLNELNIETNIRVMRWSRAYRRAVRRANVLIYSIGRTSEREDQFHWIGVVAPFETYIYALKRRDDINIETESDLLQWRIGLVSGDMRDQYFSESGDYRIHRFRNSRFVFQALLNNEIDIVAVEKNNFPFIIEALELSKDKFTALYRIDSLSQEGLYMAFGRRTSEDIVTMFKNAYNKIQK